MIRCILVLTLIASPAMADELDNLRAAGYSEFRAGRFTQAYDYFQQGIGAATALKRRLDEFTELAAIAKMAEASQAGNKTDYEQAAALYKRYVGMGDVPRRYEAYLELARAQTELGNQRAVAEAYAGARQITDDTDIAVQLARQEFAIWQKVDPYQAARLGIWLAIASPGDNYVHEQVLDLLLTDCSIAVCRKSNPPRHLRA